MASTLNRVYLTAARCSYRVRPRVSIRSRPKSLRPFHASQFSRAESADPPRGSNEELPAIAKSEVESDASQDAAKELEDLHHRSEQTMLTARDSDLEPHVRTEPDFEALEKFNLQRDLDSLTISNTDELFQLKERMSDAEFHGILQDPPSNMRDVVDSHKASVLRELNKMQREVLDSMPDKMEKRTSIPGRRFQPGLMALGEDDEEEEGEDEIFEGDDMTSLGHGHLEQHREIREYARIAAWEMPLLSKYAKPFAPPSMSTPLRFRHTSYMGESHPAEPKISLEFCTADLPLSPKQRLKLVKLLGPRYNPQQDLARMSCEMFPSAAQNKRYLGDLVDNLITEARSESSAEGGKDAFDDIPVDFRHVRVKKEPVFPEEWKMSGERRARLKEGWMGELLADQEASRGEREAVDGRKVIEESHRTVATQRRIEEDRVKVAATKGPRGRQAVLRQLMR